MLVPGHIGCPARAGSFKISFNAKIWKFIQALTLWAGAYVKKVKAIVPICF